LKLYFEISSIPFRNAVPDLNVQKYKRVWLDILGFKAKEEASFFKI